MQNSKDFNEAVQISVPVLVQLSRFAASLPLDAEKILARQSGDYQSPFKGRGMEFDESRLYQAGDDIRNIDWRVTARTGKTHTKMFREERERQVFVWVDLRASMFFATKGMYKSVIASRLASLLAWSAIHHGDRVGGVIFSDDSHHELKPQRGKTGALRLINQMVKHPTWRVSETVERDIGAVFRSLVRLRRVARPGSLIFMLSDFRNLDEKMESQLLLLSRHTNIVMVFIYDQLEQALPAAGLYRVSNGREEQMLDTYDRNRTESYQQHFLAHRSRLERLAKNSGIHLINCSTEDQPLTVLQKGLGKKTKR
jgi:uncharacterized protein (DUF58 family)